jgi:hypothetical protein
VVIGWSASVHGSRRLCFGSLLSISKSSYTFNSGKNHGVFKFMLISKMSI